MQRNIVNDRLEKENSLQAIGLWGQRRLQFIREERRSLYNALVAAGELNTYLAEIDKQAEDYLSQLVIQFAKLDGVTNALKRKDPLCWTQKMNSAQNSASEIVYRELIYC